MKRIIYTFVLFFGTMALVLTSCKGDKGDPGPAGSDGTDGVDGNAVCLTCHNLANKALVEGMYNLSGHAAGANVAYAGGRQGCAMCHGDQGFREMQYTHADTLAGDIVAPQPIQCITCHDFHSTLDFDLDGPDYALRTTDPVVWLYDPNKATVDFGGSSNLCANCHQSRREPPSGTGDFDITSTHWGPHHGPQANLLAGKGFYEVGSGYPTSNHAHFAVGCTGCHMHMEEGVTTEGGHTWHPTVASCVGCHSSATDFDIMGVQTDVHDLLESIKDEMVAIGLYDDAAGHVVTGTWTVEQAGAYFNWIGVEEDRSLGVHNPDYIVTLLENTLATF